MTDLFPTTPLLDGPPRLTTYASLVDLEDVTVFNVRVGRRYVLEFSSQPLPSGGKLRDNYKRTLEGAGFFNGSKFHPDKVGIENLFGRLDKPFRPMHYTDVRAGFALDDGHSFLVKSMFTFGQRTVPPGQVYVYRTERVPVLFYFYRPPSDGSEYKLKAGRLHPKDDGLYDRFLLKPQTTYVVPAGVTHLVVTLQKTLLRVWVADAWKGESPTGLRVTADMSSRRWKPPQEWLDASIGYLSEKKRADHRKENGNASTTTTTPPRDLQSPDASRPSESRCLDASSRQPSESRHGSSNLSMPSAFSLFQHASSSSESGDPMQQPSESSVQTSFSMPSESRHGSVQNSSSQPSESRHDASYSMPSEFSLFQHPSSMQPSEFRHDSVQMPSESGHDFVSSSQQPPSVHFLMQQPSESSLFEHDDDFVFADESSSVPSGHEGANFDRNVNELFKKMEEDCSEWFAAGGSNIESTLPPDTSKEVMDYIQHLTQQNRMLTLQLNVYKQNCSCRTY